MLNMGRCRECNVPDLFYQSHEWLNNGDIVQRANHRARMGMIESEALDPLFTNVGKIIGTSIYPQIINIISRGSKIYLDKLMPEEFKDLVRSKQGDFSQIAEPIMTLCHVMGFGQYDFRGYRYEDDPDDYAIVRIFRPFSVPEVVGAFAGAISAVVGGEHSVSYEEISPGMYEVTTRWTEYEEVLKEKLHIYEYHHRDGDIEFERCATCSCPKPFSDYFWDLEKGVVVNGKTGRRMALIGFEMLGAVFLALEDELGDTIPRVVVEAQRRFVKTGFYSIEDVRDENVLRNELALRGLGNVQELTMNPKGLRLRINNVSGHLLTIGIVQGIFEMALNVKSFVDWELSEEGNLDVEVTPRATREPIGV
jgi:hypothetical protein